MYKNEQKLRHGQALAMQWVAFALQKIIADVHSGGDITRLLLHDAKNVKGEEGLDTLGTGCNYVVNFVLPLTIELSIKALILKEGNIPKREHNLLLLFNQLSIKKQNELENKYCNDTELIKDNKSSHLKQLLIRHKSDFENWRYLENAGALHKEEKKLQFVICVMLDVYNIND